MVPEAERGVGIEEQGKKWARARRERILSHPPSEAIRVTSEETLQVFSFPPLAEGDKRKYTVRFSPFTGKIYVPIWHHLPVVEDGEKRFLENPSGLVQLRRPKERRVDFGNLPPREVVQLYYLRLPSIEAAIRQQVHIMDKYQEGKEAQQIESLMRFLDFQFQATSGQITRQSLATLAEQTATFLVNSGFLTAVDPTKRRIAELLAKASQLDRLGRVNPLAVRVRLRAAYLEAVRREMMPVLVSEKFGSFLGILLMEREVTRGIMEEAVTVLDTMVGMTKRGAAVFEEERPRYSGGDIVGMEEVLRKVAVSLARVRVLPYLPAARKAAINLVSCRPQWQDLNRRIIGKEAGRLFSLLPVIELIELRHFQEAKRRVIELSYNPLIQVLEENKEIGVEID